MHGDDYPFTGNHSNRHEPETPTGVLRVAGIIAVAFLFASTVPPAVVPFVMAQLLTVAALVSSGIAVAIKEHPVAAGMTRWDEAAILGVLALGIGFFVDHEAAKSVLEILAARG